jgi:hypothetical protein
VSLSPCKADEEGVGARPNGGPTAKMVARVAWSKAARRELPRAATPDAHGRDTGRRGERGGRLDSRPLRISGYQRRLSRNPLFRTRHFAEPELRMDSMERRGDGVNAFSVDCANAC